MCWGWGEKCGCLGGRWFREGGIRSTKFQKKIGLPVRNLFKKTHFLKVEVGFFFDKKSFSQIGQICEDLFFIN